MGGREQNNNDRNESGQFTEKYPKRVFLDALRGLGGEAGTTNVADEVGCPRRTAYHRLSNLRDEGRIDSRKIGNAMLWVIEDGE